MDKRNAPPSTDADSDETPQLDRAAILRILAAIIAADDTVTGITSISPDGEVSYLSADQIRRGGKA